MTTSLKSLRARKLTAVSLFSGCGGFDWGVSQTGINIVWANDIDKAATTGYKALFPDVEFVHGDIANVKNFPKADVLIGCYPCTGFSMGARRRWREQEARNLKSNDNNFLYKEFLRVLRQVKPRYFFIENVDGMRTAEDGWFLKQQILSFAKQGYRIVEPKLLNASHFGVPQERKRMFIVGTRKDQDVEYVFPKPTHGKGLQSIVTLKDVIGDESKWPLWPKHEFYNYKFHGHYLTRNRKRPWNSPSFTIVAHQSHIPLHPMGEPMVRLAIDLWSLQGDQNRRLSWRECAAIQGFPEHFEPDLPLSSLYRIIGNAVPPVLGKILMQPIVEFESK